MTDNRVTITIENGVAEVTLNRAEKMNAWDEAMFTQVARAGERLMEETGLRAVVLTGAGRAFSAGIDTAMLAGFAGRLDALRAEIVAPPPGQAANRF